MSYKNLFIFVADALRYNYVPKEICEQGTLVETLAPSLHSPPAFTSLVTGKSPENHTVRSFFDELNYKSIFDCFEHPSYYDYPKGPLTNVLFRKIPRISLERIKEPFITVERSLYTHLPLGESWRDGKYYRQTHESMNRRKYGEKLLKEGKLEQTYKDAVEKVVHLFQEKMDILQDRGMLQDTLVIFTADHGTLLGEKFQFGIRRYFHGQAHPMCREIAVVPTVFLNCDLNFSFMRTIDIVPTALGLMGKACPQLLTKCDGVDRRKKTVHKGVNKVRSFLEVEWEYTDSGWQLPNQPIKRLETNIKSFIRLLEVALVIHPGGPTFISELKRKIMNIF